MAINVDGTRGSANTSDSPASQMWDRLDRWASRRFGRFVERLEKLPPWRLDLTAVGSLALSVFVDLSVHILGTGALSVSPLYTVSIAFTGFFCRLWLVVASSAVAATIWTLLDAQTREGATGYAAVWNGLARFALFVFVGALMNLLRSRLDEEARLANTDSLTGVANSRAFYARSRTEIARARRNRTPITFAYLDVDDFKSINDTFGHPAGDRVLSALAAALCEGVRETDIVGRLGGDEFAMVFPDTDLSAARQVIERVRSETSSLAIAGRRVGFTLGAVAFDEAPPDPDVALAEVDLLLYEGKDAGRGVTRVAQGPLALPAEARPSTAQERALTR